MKSVYKLKYLTGLKLKVFLAAADRIIPPDGSTPGGGTLATAGVADWSLGRMDPKNRSQILVLLLGVQMLGFFFGAKPFTMLSDEAKDRQLRWMEDSPIRLMRMGMFGLKSFACMGYYTREETWAALGYAGPIKPERTFPDQAIRDLCQGRSEVVS